MPTWSTETKDELALILKDWLKHQGRSQAELKASLRATTTRMPSLIEVLENEYRLGGLLRVVGKLCQVEAEWNNKERGILESKETKESDDPFDQLDLLLEEIQEDCNS